MLDLHPSPHLIVVKPILLFGYVSWDTLRDGDHVGRYLLAVLVQQGALGRLLWFRGRGLLWRGDVLSHLFLRDTSRSWFAALALRFLIGGGLLSEVLLSDRRFQIGRILTRFLNVWVLHSLSF